MEFSKAILKLQNQCKKDGLTVKSFISKNIYSVFIYSKKLSSGIKLYTVEEVEDILTKNIFEVIEKEKQRKILADIKSLGYIDEKFDKFFGIE